MSIDNENYYLPFGQSMLNPILPGVNYDVSGLFKYDDQYIRIINRAKLLYNCVLPIKTVHGCYPVLWNGGRDQKDLTDPVVRRHLDFIIKIYNDIDVGVYYTFTNHLIEEKHLDDRDSNILLDAIGERSYENNGVIVSSDVLSDYIRGKYPNLKQKSSIIKADVEMPNPGGGRTFEYYNRLSEKYDKVVLTPDDGFNVNILEQIAAAGTQDKYLVIINENCVQQCQVRNLHYTTTAKRTLDPTITGPHPYNPFYSKTLCPSNMVMLNKGNPRRDKQPRSCRFNNNDLTLIHKLGFRNLKMQGRDVDWNFMANDLWRYIIGNDSDHTNFFHISDICYG